MLTPIVAHLLERRAVLDHYVTDSKTKDASWVVGWFRNPVLSAYQQEKASALSSILSKIDLTRIDDDGICEKLSTFLENTIRDLTLTVALHKEPGKTTWLMLELQLFQKRLTAAQQYFYTAGLKNQPHQGSALIVFKTGLCNYLIDREVYKYALEINYYYWFKHLVFNNDLSAKKETMVKTALYNTIYKETDDFKIFVNDLLQQDKNLIEDQRIETSIPIGVGPFHIDVPVSIIYTPKTLTDALTATHDLLKLKKFAPKKIPKDQASSNNIPEVKPPETKKSTGSPLMYSGPRTITKDIATPENNITELSSKIDKPITESEIQDEDAEEYYSDDEGGSNHLSPT